MAPWNMKFPALGARPTSTTNAVSGVELGDMNAPGAAENGQQREVDEQMEETAAGPLSMSTDPEAQPREGSSTPHQHRAAKRGRRDEEEPQARSTIFVTAPNDLLQEKVKQQIEMAVRKEASDKHQEEFDRMKQDFERQIAAMRNEMDGFRKTTFNTVQQLKNELQVARKTATDAQGENFEMAEELIRLRAGRRGEDNTTTSDAAPSGHIERPMDVDTDRAAVGALQQENMQLHEELENPWKNATAHEHPKQTLIVYERSAGNNEDIEYAMEENNGVQGYGQRGRSTGEWDDEDDEHADNESEGQGEGGADEDVDMQERPPRPRPLSARANRPRGHIDGYVEESDSSEDLDALLGSDFSMEEATNGANSPQRRKGSTGRSQIPPPQQFKRPRGGAGPSTTVRTGTSKAAPTSPQSGRKNNNDRDYRRKVGQGQEWYRQKGKGSGQNSGTGNAEERASGRAGRPSKRLQVFRVVPLRGSDIDRAKVLNHVDLMMNKLMNMTAYADIINVPLADNEEATNFAQGKGVAPRLKPLRPYFGKGFGKHAWNLHLENLFAEYYEDEMQVELDQEAEDKIAVMFRSRIERLRRRYLELTKEMSAAEKEIREERKKAGGRRNTRRLTLFDVRRTICLESIENPDGTIDENWKILLEMVLELGSYGMSSDESEVDDKGTPHYRVRKRLWRSREVSDRLDYIDRSRNTDNGKGKRMPGNSARDRIRSPRSEVSTRDPSTECPRNFYDAGYLKNLDNLHYRALMMKKSTDLGDMVR